MQSLNQSVALAVAADRRRRASARAVSRGPRPKGPPGVRGSAAVLAARVARRLDAEAARRVTA